MCPALRGVVPAARWSVCCSRAVAHVGFCSEKTQQVLAALAGQLLPFDIRLRGCTKDSCVTLADVGIGDTKPISKQSGALPVNCRRQP